MKYLAFILYLLSFASFSSVEALTEHSFENSKLEQLGFFKILTNAKAEKPEIVMLSFPKMFEKKYTAVEVLLSGYNKNKLLFSAPLTFDFNDNGNLGSTYFVQRESSEVTLKVSIKYIDTSIEYSFVHGHKINLGDITSLKQSTYTKYVNWQPPS
ncbi:hypothetical protein SOPP22_16715 [Shewanella sp. OPT22]|nr:hypothetical protein SOPP22_16715 [Shewanella sp. OPT22]